VVAENSDENSVLVTILELRAFLMVLILNYMHPPLAHKLVNGDKTQVVAPSRSLAIVSEKVRRSAMLRLQSTGLHVTYGTHALECDESASSAIVSRIKDLHAAFTDDSVAAVLSAIGGVNSRELLPFLDFDLIKAHPKILCGYSDITALTLAVYAKTGLITYSGPHFSTFGMLRGVEYTVQFFKHAVMSDAPYVLEPAAYWSDDTWHVNQNNRIFTPNRGPLVVQTGVAHGHFVGGNLSTMIHLKGTEYMPSLRDALLFVEVADHCNGNEFLNLLESLMEMPDFDEIQALLVGRFQIGSGISDLDLVSMLKGYRQLQDIPIVANFSFGHTTPQSTLPIGGEGSLVAKEGDIRLIIRRH
jgi:muramoyltetrapeptide carboxypeptidase